MVDVSHAVSIFGIPPDAKDQELENHLEKVGSLESLLTVKEAHSNLCTGRGYAIYSTSTEAGKAITDLSGVCLREEETSKLSLEAVQTDRTADITTLLGKKRLDTLNLTSIVGKGSDFIDQMVDKLSSLSDSEVSQLFSKMKSKRGHGLFQSTERTTYAVSSPKLPSFSGNQGKSGIGYEQWRSQLKTLLADQSYSDFQIMNAIYQSVKGTAGDVLLSMPEGSTSHDILDKFDKYFGNGNVLSVDMLTEQFHSSKQQPKENVVTWSCRLQRMLDHIGQKEHMPRSYYDQLLRAKFWNGLSVKHIKEATRHRFENSESFDEIFAAARSLELEESQSSKQLISKNVVSQQVAASEPTPESSVLTKIFNRLSTMENRLSKIEASSKQPRRASLSGQSPADDDLFCSRCKRNTHRLETCHARKEKYGKPLKN